MIAFGSCNRQDKSQDYWEKIISLKPEWFLWIGDVVYAKKQTLKSLEEGLKLQNSHKQYQRLILNTRVDGVWDDHDYGINDAGKYVVDRRQRQEKYVDFLINSGSSDLEYLYKQDGLYHTRDIVVDNTSVRVIFLDTRSFRDHPYIRSLGEVDFPLSAIVAAAIRASYSVLGFGRMFEGDVLGSEQWRWLEEQLKEASTPSDASPEFTIIVSSIQLLTTNPVVESWSHFPLAKKRFFDLLSKYNLANLLFLSGDVHMGELSSAQYHRADGKSGAWYEVTSSGLTHTCATSRLNRHLCPLMTWLFDSHRVNSKAFTHDKNFGLISFHQNKNQEKYANISVFSLETDSIASVLSLEIPLQQQNKVAMNVVTEVDFPDFPVLKAQYQVAIYALIASIVFVIVLLLQRCRALKKRKIT
eukprot:gene2711-2888_t